MQIGFRPKIVAFCCNWCSYAGADLAGSSRLSYPADVKIIRVPCSCRVNPMFILRAFEKGADGVIMCGCHPGDCHYSTGNFYARRRMTLLFSMLDFIGVENGRCRVEWVSAAEGAKFSQTMNEFVEKICSLGENVRLSNLRKTGSQQTAFTINTEKRETHRLVGAVVTDASWTGEGSKVSEKEENGNQMSVVTGDPEAGQYEPECGSQTAKTEESLKIRLAQLLESGKAARVLGWKKGETDYDPEPAFFENKDELGAFVYNDFCGANLSKYMIEAAGLDGVTAVVLKPCDTYSFNQLMTEHRVVREKTYIIGVGCCGKLSISGIRAQGVTGIEENGIEVTDDRIKIKTVYGDREIERNSAMLERCGVCKGKEHRIFDELIGESRDTTICAGTGKACGSAAPDSTVSNAAAGRENSGKDQRFAEVERIEKLSAKERFEYFSNELSRCIRCNACRNVCPACSCIKCVFDGNQFDEAAKANSEPFEEKMFHIIRAFHVAGRCTDCGECSRVCPQNIPLHLFNRKFIKDINELYGEYCAGYEAGSVSPLTRFTMQDAEPSVVTERSKGC